MKKKMTKACVQQVVIEGESDDELAVGGGSG
jgi:hypothetical protein